MLSRRLTCLILALVVLMGPVVPTAIGDDTPPGDSGSIHPWDNNDDYWYNRNWLLSFRRNTWLMGYGPGGLFATWVPRPLVMQPRRAEVRNTESTTVKKSAIRQLERENKR